MVRQSQLNSCVSSHSHTTNKSGDLNVALNCEAEQSNKGVVRTPQGTD